MWKAASRRDHSGHPLEGRRAHRVTCAAPTTCVRIALIRRRRRWAQSGCLRASAPMISSPARSNRNGVLNWPRQPLERANESTALRSHHEIPCYNPERRATEGWMNLTEASKLARYQR